VSTSFELLHNRKYQFITNLYQCDGCGRGFSDTIFPSLMPVLVVASRRLSFSVSFRFLFWDLTCFVVENVLSHQARNQLGTLGWQKCFLRGAQVFKLCPIVLNYVQQIFPVRAKLPCAPAPYLRACLTQVCISKHRVHF